MDIKPHLSKYWLTSGQDPDKEEKIEAICDFYKKVKELNQQGERTLSTDEMTGVQALERSHPGLPMLPGKIERREFEYIRHGTLCFTVNFDIFSGFIVSPTCGLHRKEEDFVMHIKNTVETDKEAKKWHIVLDNLNTHISEGLVRYVAALSHVTDDLGVKGSSGILKNKSSRAEFLSDPSHKIVFHYTPKHCSWLNQVEIWFSILVRKVLRRGNFSSLEDLREKVLSFIDYFNETMAKPFKWTYQGKPMAI